MVGNVDFVPLVKPTTVQPLTIDAKGKKPVFFGLPIPALVLLRDQLPISTWLALGSALQAVLYGILGKYAFLPAFVYLLHRTIDAYLMATGLKHNKYMDGVLLNKFSAQYPDAEGNFGSSPANDKMCVLLIGTRTNHPLGILAPGAKEVGDFMGSMTDYLDKHGEEFGYLGNSTWAATERTAGNEIMSVMYFRSHEGVHKFAHHDIHRKAWNWWNKEVKKMPYIGIWHELYVAPKGNWETIYVNSAPTLASANIFKTKGEDGKPLFVSPIVDARKGLLKTSAGRMSKSNATEHDTYNDDPYENYGKLGYQ